MDSIVRRSTVETFGPVRSVQPTQVFELGFEGIAPSKRHKSGVAVRFPACCAGGVTSRSRKPTRWTRSGRFWRPGGRGGEARGWVRRGTKYRPNGTTRP
jgi:hypothetical protein